MNNQQRFTEYFYNSITVAGIVLVAFVAIIETILFAVDIWIGIDSPYFGMLTFLILPPLFVLGAVLIPGGALIERRRRLQSPDVAVRKTFLIDFSNPTHRNTAVAFLIGGIVFLVLVAVGSYHTYHFTESVKFCGELCHKVMNPEFTAYQTSAHARVKCALCHIGPGAGWFAKSKISGAYQIYAVMADKYPKPIPTPIRNLRPAQETCEQCHWPQQFYSPKERTYPHFKSDEKNTPAPTRLMVNVGGGIVGKSQTGIHLHMNINHRIEYIPSDASRENIVMVRSTNRVTGEVKEYRVKDYPLADTEITPDRLRRMDCMDCHNRPAHKFPSPQSAVNDAMEAGSIDRNMPFIKREAVKALDQDYATIPEAMSGIASHLRTFYSNQYPDLIKTDMSQLTNVTLAVQDIYRKIRFPEMKASWKSYPDHIGHLNSPGCFRCHNSNLVSTSGETVSRNCHVCHSFLKLESHAGTKARTYVTSEEYDHPGDVGDMWKETPCHECHRGGAELYE